MDRPDGLAAAIAGHANPGACVRLYVSGGDEHGATAAQDDRMSDRQRVRFGGTLPLVLAKYDKVGVAGLGADPPADIAGCLEPS